MNKVSNLAITYRHINTNTKIDLIYNWFKSLESHLNKIVCSRLLDDSERIEIFLSTLCPDGLNSSLLNRFE